MTPKIIDHMLIAGEYTEAMPHLSQPTVVRVWSVPVEYRESGYFASSEQPGKSAELPACATDDATLIAVLDLPASEAAKLSAAIAERNAASIAATDRMLMQFASGYPSTEILSWPQQVKEAEAMQADTGASTPLLDALAVARGLGREELAGRVIINSAAYAQASGDIIGARQRIEDLLLAATDFDSLGAVPSLEELLSE